MDAKWGLNGEDEKTLWDDWVVDVKDYDEIMEEEVVAKKDDIGGNGRPPSRREVRLWAHALN